MKLALILAAVAFTAAAPAPAPAPVPADLWKRSPPGIPSPATARSLLAGLAIRTTDPGGYDRSLFPHWITISGTCEYALISPPPLLH